MPGGRIQDTNTSLTFSIGDLIDTAVYTITPRNPTHLETFLITQWVSINNLDIQVALQARDDEDQTNINPTTVTIVISPNALIGLGSVSVQRSCTVDIPSGICSVSVSVPLFWLSGLVSDVANAIVVTANFDGSTSPIPLGSVNARFEESCTLVNNILLVAPTYTQFTGSLVSVPVMASAVEGVDSFSLEFVISSGLEFVRIDSAEFYGYSYVSDSSRHYVTGSTNRFPIPTGTTDHLLTIVLSVSTSVCSDQSITAKVIFLSDGQQQIVSLIFCFV